MNPESILNSVKKMLGGFTSNYTYFDTDIIIHINSVFMTLQQIGVGPEEGYAIVDENDLWTDYLPDSTLLNAVKTYMYLKVKLLFDPPTSSIAVDSMNNMIAEFEWRIKHQTEEQNQNG